MFVSAYDPGSERSEEEREAFWSELAECVEERKRRWCQVIVVGDLNARIGNEEVHGVMGSMGYREGFSVETDCYRCMLRRN